MTLVGGIEMRRCIRDVGIISRLLLVPPLVSSSSGSIIQLGFFSGMIQLLECEIFGHGVLTCWTPDWEDSWIPVKSVDG